MKFSRKAFNERERNRTHRTTKGARYRKGGKPPKLRFKPGWFIRYKGQLYEIIYAYRLVGQPHEWFFSIEERSSLRTPDSLMSVYCDKEMPPPPLSERVFYDLFLNGGEAFYEFANIYVHADRDTVSNQQLLTHGEVVSECEVDDPGPLQALTNKK